VDRNRRVFNAYGKGSFNCSDVMRLVWSFNEQSLPFFELCYNEESVFISIYLYHGKVSDNFVTSSVHPFLSP